MYLPDQGLPQAFHLQTFHSAVCDFPRRAGVQDPGLALVRVYGCTSHIALTAIEGLGLAPLTLVLFAGSLLVLALQLPTVPLQVIRLAMVLALLGLLDLPPRGSLPWLLNDNGLGEARFKDRCDKDWLFRLP